MRIAYVTPYQGPTLIKKRPSVRNRSMSNTIKIELIAQLLRSKSHDIEVFSHGEVIENELAFYPAFDEPDRFHPKIPVYYISALPLRGVNGLWARLRMTALLTRRHRVSPFDVLMIFNLKPPQLASARYAVRHRIPVILEYEDDVFHDVSGGSPPGLVARYHEQRYRSALTGLSGCIAVSPYLLSQLPSGTPKLLLRGVVAHDLLIASKRHRASKKDIVLFSGTHTRSNGVEELIKAWRIGAPSGWELHVTGSGHMTEQLRRMAVNSVGVVFHGLVRREALVSLLCSAKICINPHAVSRTPGNVFAFKMIEYLAAGAHVITTPMGELEPELEAGVTYMKDNAPETIAATLKQVIENRRYGSNAECAVQERYGPQAVSDALDAFLGRVVSR
jgi:glycosyltransferase involved in cell wall biosynthesis